MTILIKHVVSANLDSDEYHFAVHGLVIKKRSSG